MNLIDLEKALGQNLFFLPEAGKIELSGNRMMMFNQAAVGALRKIVIEQVGDNVARMLFAKFGYESAIQDYRALDKIFPHIEEREKLEIGPLMHAWCGIVKVIPEYFHSNREASEFRFRGRWINSHEAISHLELFGKSQHPVCFSLTGYGSAWCSQFFGSDLLEVETKCLARGDEYCEWEVRPWQEWGSEADPWKKSLKNTDRSFIAKLSDQQQKIDHLKNNLDKIIATRLAESAAELRALCHDINAPLQLALSNIQEGMVSGDPRTTKRAAWSLSQAQNMVNRFQKKRLSTAGKVEFNRTAVEFSKLVSESVSLVGDKLVAKNVELEVNAKAGIFTFTDADIVRDHILVNLLINAIKFSPASSKIKVDAIQIAPGKTLIKIRDHGIGMPKDLIQKIFFGHRIESNRGTAGETGMGFGLSVANHYARKLGGKIWLESQPVADDPINCGTTVYLEL